KKYRPNVAAIIMSPDYPNACEVFIAERIDIEGAWQFPQGGIDEGETPLEALYRELLEEIGTNEIEILAQYPRW
ncbi:RNA pyrophosphohydrolase, partial [Helicobacter pylori]